MGTVRAADISEVITCYGHDGSAWANNTRCPGSDACGGIDAHVYRTDCVTNLKTDLVLSSGGLVQSNLGTRAYAPRFANTACLVNYNNRHSYTISTAQPWGTTLRAKPYFPTLT